MFLATSQIINGSSLLQITQNVQLLSLKNTVYTMFSCIIQNPVLSVWCYHLPLFGNVETLVGSYMLLEATAYPLSLPSFVFHVTYLPISVYSNTCFLQICQVPRRPASI